MSADLLPANHVSRYADNGFLLHLNSHEIKQKLIKAARTSRPEGLHVNEFLTKKRLGLLKGLRKMKSDQEKFHSVFTRNGRIFFKDEETASPQTNRGCVTIFSEHIFRYIGIYLYILAIFSMYLLN